MVDICGVINIYPPESLTYLLTLILTHIDMKNLA